MAGLITSLFKVNILHYRGKDALFYIVGVPPTSLSVTQAVPLIAVNVMSLFPRSIFFEVFKQNPMESNPNLIIAIYFICFFPLLFSFQHKENDRSNMRLLKCSYI